MNLNTLKPAYFKVGYSILTPSYYQSAGCVGFRNDSESTAFYADCERIFRIGGWNVERGYAINGNSKLHLHPQQFLGVVQTELIDTIPELISQANLFTFQQNGKRLFEAVYDITPDQQQEYLAARRLEIEAELLKKFRTSQRKLYHVVDGLLLLDFELLGRRYGLPALDEQANALAARRYVSNVFYSLITTGQIIRKVIKGNPAYRTTMKCELPVSRKKPVKPSPDTPELF